MQTNYIKFILTGFIFTLLASCGGNQSKGGYSAVIEYAKTQGYTIKSNSVQNADPAILYCYSNYLWGKGQKNEAVFWYYDARYRARLLAFSAENIGAGSFDEATAKEILLGTGIYQNKADLANLHMIGGEYRLDLYEVIQGVLGAKINGYAFGDLKFVKSSMDSMLAYEEKYPFNPKNLYPAPVLKSDEIIKESVDSVREGFIKEEKMITEQADQIRAERTKNGLENRN